MLLISIVTINLNNSEGLKNTLQSICFQSYQEYEIIIVDGGSTDNSLKVIQNNSNKIKYWVSEPDSGIYDAMNKGIKSANGKYIIFLNSGDTFYSSNSLSDAIAEIDDEDILYGNINVVTESSSWIKTYPSSLSFSYFLKDTLPHPASLIKKSLFDKIGLFNESNKIVSDWEFFLLAVNKYNCTYKYLPFIISNFVQDGISSDPKSSIIIASEKDRILLKHFPTFLDDFNQYFNMKEEYDVLQRKYNLLSNSITFRLHKLFKTLFVRA